MELITKNRRLFIILFIASSLLLIPLVSMQFTNEVNWKLFDFIVAGFLFISTGLIMEYLLRKVKSKRIRIIIIV